MRFLTLIDKCDDKLLVPFELDGDGEIAMSIVFGEPLMAATILLSNEQVIQLRDHLNEVLGEESTILTRGSNRGSYEF